MITVITETTVKPGQETAWDRAYAERASDAQQQAGWVQLQLLVPEDEPRTRVVIGTWSDREAWKRWHETDTFKRTREALDAATDRHGEDRWYRVGEQEAGEAAGA
jgi:heme-degrading monooxygenase HmoA